MQKKFLHDTIHRLDCFLVLRPYVHMQSESMQGPYICGFEHLSVHSPNSPQIKVCAPLTKCWFWLSNTVTILKAKRIIEGPRDENPADLEVGAAVSCSRHGTAIKHQTVLSPSSQQIPV